MAVAFTQTANPAGAGSGTTIAYNGLSTGTAAHDRVVVLAVSSEAGTGVITSATINFGAGAVAMNASTNGALGAMGARIFWLQAPVGTTADFSIVFGASQTSTTQHVAVYNVQGAQGTATSSGSNSSTDMDSSTPLTTGSTTIAASGGMIAVLGKATDTVNATWANLTGDITQDAGGFQFQTATSTSAGTATRTATGSTNQEDGALAWVIFAANSSVERLPARVDLAFSPTAPDAHVANIGITVPQGNIAFSSVAPAVGIEKPLNTADLGITTTAPTAVAFLNIGVSTPQGNLALTPTAPTATLAVAGQPTHYQFNISTTAPTVDVNAGAVITSARVDLGISTFAPAVGISKELDTKDLSISTTAPTLAVSGGVIAISVPSANLTISSAAPDAGLAWDIACGQAVISTTAPTVGIAASTNVTSNPARVDLVISTTAPTATVVSSGNIAIDPPSGNLAFSSVKPAIGMEKPLDADDLIITTTAPTALITAVNNLSPARVDLVISTTAPTLVIASGGQIIPVAKDLVISTTAPTATLSVNFSPAHVDLLLTEIAPSMVNSGQAITGAPPAGGIIEHGIHWGRGGRVREG